MTKQEAVEELKKVIEHNETCWFDDYMPLSKEATELAIKALEAQGNQTTDLISRQAVLNLAKEGKLLSGNIYIKASDYINELPSAEPKRGKWIDKGDFYVCSECGEKMTYTVIGEDTKLTKLAYAYYSDYCPSCGAKMESDEQ